MTDGFADLVMPLFRKVLDLRRRLERGEARTLDDAMRQVQSWIDEAGRRAVTDPTLGRVFDEARYGLVAWIDEVLTDSEWGHSVGWGFEQHVLEWLTFRSHDRAWRFYEHAEDLDARGAFDPLEAYLVCVTLGFRGELAQDPDRMTDWVERIYARVGEGGSVESRPFPEEEPGAGLQPLRGPSLLVKVSALAAFTLLFTLAAYLFAIHHDYYSAG
ncbi:DotU family type IV/VI secretion system protein [Paludisphaera mucosa]|uniref:DotU family type IV/VI secretion system protein n=1 Tax=Paludisphaera mucosa TaxID=3030827 RepID=A0ABT6FDY9_9BACT|nr:DotU family type IV/VI secretion system protein [Paludisphaera mucosa]MDG3005791.1 DotU family type IV/VI secretion system protein [Paludisphaera mucosa]